MDRQGRTIRILLVDDHEMVLNTMAAVMRLESDFEVVGTAMTIAGALEQAVAHQPDVVVIDYRLPDGDGVVATRKLRQLLTGVRVVMLTGMDDPATRIEAFEAGCSAFVAKGARIDELARAVRTAAAAQAPG